MRYTIIQDGNHEEYIREWFLNYKVMDTLTEKPAGHFYCYGMAKIFMDALNDKDKDNEKVH